MTLSRMNSCLQFGCPNSLISEISSTGTISNSFSVCSRSARWRAVVVLPDPGLPIIVVIGCDWTFSRMLGKLWISWNGLSSFRQDSKSLLSCATKQKWYEMYHSFTLHPLHNIIQHPRLYEKPCTFFVICIPNCIFPLPSITHPLLNMSPVQLYNIWWPREVFHTSYEKFSFYTRFI